MYNILSFTNLITKDEIKLLPAEEDQINSHINHADICTKCL